MSSVLIATLGAEPQVIALSAQLLCRQGEPLTEVVVLHTCPNRPPISKALPALLTAFTAHPDWPQLQTILIAEDDVLTPKQIDCFSEVLYQELKTRVARRQHVHLLLAGGRKPMAMVGMTVAQMILGPDDRVWYLYSDEDLRIAKRFELHANDDVRLIPIQLPPLTPAPPGYTRAIAAATPDEARQVYESEQQRQLRRFVEHDLTHAEREVATLVATQVLSTQEIATALHKSPKTVTNQLNTIYDKLESSFGLQPDKGIKREFLRRQLRSYFDRICVEIS